MCDSEVKYRRVRTQRPRELICRSSACEWSNLNERPMGEEISSEEGRRGDEKRDWEKR